MFLLSKSEQIMPFCVFIYSLIVVFTLSFGSAKAQTLSFPSYTIETIAKGLDYPWALAFLPDGDLLVTERTGQIRIVSQNTVSEPLVGLPKDIYVQGQGGLLDVVLHPNYHINGWLYLSYTVGSDDKNALQVMRAKLSGNQLIQQQIMFTVSPFKDTPVHFAGRMTFLPDNSLLITSGDGFDYREDAQRLNNLLGKVIRINDDGSIPANNPFLSEDVDSLSNYVFTYGHRNAQAILYDPSRGVIFSNEHGPDGGDELNIIQAGVNYGWPVITFGNDYIGGRISPFTDYPNMQQPLIDWTPSIAPSGMAVHSGELFKALNGDLLISVLKFKEVRWVQMDGINVVGQVSLFKELGQRIRDVRVHPDGSIYVLTDSAQGKVLRVVPD
ncbi:PQQ-dependent sugar dehydrogenase [uncultured Paraglaciecola sp.]|jgi:glucose/arabinose dehydrogenase|uniref:PQQ-dependent sugar dehydrogenase n=1 Tax=uncultured Paraglaciecola sp. TaxID=1765024 RepID=UPI002607E997|nr:PQQ-dependent sugar dehydrogenase [uncultured Paraglaciecola sp.]